MLLRNIWGAFRRPNGTSSNRLGPTHFSQTFYFSESMTSCVYEKAIVALNGLQSNAAYLQKARAERSNKAYQNLTDTMKHLETLKITLDDVDSLNIIHVAGTKGKGSTCAFTENILRSHSYKTGFYSSPHLISVNERIRINGNPLSKEKFAAYFFEVYDIIKCSLKEDERMPSYFLFLTVMAFYVFIKEKVEAAIIEVGIGGLYDCTNFIRKPIAVGITTLGIDHINLLGGTITEIAEQKAGIMKTGVPAFTVSQPENALRVLRKKSLHIKCPLFLSPPLESYESKISLGVQGIVQNVNASLALQLSQCWLKSLKSIGQNSKTQQLYQLENLSLNEELPLTIADTFHINKETRRALEHCIWPGRFQIFEKNQLTYYLDGAHTHESMKHCGRWFEEEVLKYNTKFKLPSLKVLYFNCTGERRAESLLDPLADIHFDVVVFSPNKISAIKDNASDLSNFMVEPTQEMQQCIANNEIWCHLMRSLYEDQLSITNYSTPSHFTENELSIDCDNTITFQSVTDAINWLSSSNHQRNKQDIKMKKLKETLLSASHVHVLVTGSLHLVGGVLSLIQS